MVWFNLPKCEFLQTNFVIYNLQLLLFRHILQESSNNYCFYQFYKNQ